MKTFLIYMAVIASFFGITSAVIRVMDMPEWDGPLYTDQTAVCIRDLHVRVIIIQYPLGLDQGYEILFPSGAILRLSEIELTECIPIEELLP